MKPKLPRAMLWNDKKTLDELIAEKPGEILYRMYIRLMRGLYPPHTGIKPVEMMNEVLYQCTRVVYEKSPDVDLNEYIQDIKANVGLKQTTRLVLILMFYLLIMQRDKSDEIMRFIDQLREYFKPPRQHHLEIDFENCFIDSILAKEADIDFILFPHPCPAVELEGMAIDWVDLTQGFSRSKINEILWLWKDDWEAARVLRMIEGAFKQRDLSLFEKQEDVVDNGFFAKTRGLLDLDENYEQIEFEIHEPFATINEYSQKNILLEKRNSELESENERLKSELNMTKSKKEQERSFTLSMIVDYCKNRSELRQVEPIIHMLYKFLRRKGTEQEYEMVDEIETVISEKKSGDTIMGDKNEFNDNSGLNRITLPPGITPQEAIKLLQFKVEEDGEEG